MFGESHTWMADVKISPGVIDRWLIAYGTTESLPRQFSSDHNAINEELQMVRTANKKPKRSDQTESIGRVTVGVSERTP